MRWFGLLIAAAGCAGPARSASRADPCPAPGGDAAARHAAFVELRATWPRCELTLPALASAAGVSAERLRAYVTGDPASNDATIWSARGALANRDLTTARRVLAAELDIAPSPVVLAELARVERAAGDVAAADRALTEAIALAALDDARPVVAWIPDRASGRIAVRPDGRRWANSILNRIIIHDTVTGLEVASVASARGDVTEAYSFALLDDARVVISPYSDGEGWVVDPADGIQIPLFVGTSLLGVGPDGATVMTANSSTISIVGLTRGREGKDVETVAAFDGDGWPGEIEWRGDVATVPLEGARLRVLHLQAGKIATGSLYGPGIIASTLDPGGVELGVAQADWVGRYESVTGTPIANAALPAGVAIDQLSYADGALYAVDQAVGDVYRLDDSTLTLLATGLPIEGRWPGDDSWRSLGDTRVLVADGGVLELRGTPRLVAPRIVPGAPIDALAWSGGTLAIATTEGQALVDADGLIARFDRELATTPGATFAIRPGTSEVWWSTPSGMRASIGGAIELVAGTGPATPGAARGPVTPGSIDDATHRITLRMMDAKVWGRSPSEQAAITQAVLLRSDPYGNPSAAFSADGGTAIVQPWDGKDVQVVDTETLEVQSLLRVPDRALALALVDDDRRLVISTFDPTYVVNRKRGVVEREVPGMMVAVSADGHWLVTEHDQAYVVRDLHRNRDLGTLELDLPRVAAFDPTGTWLAIGQSNGELVVLSTDDWKPAARWTAAEVDLTALAWRPDGALLASGGEGGVVRLWTPTGEPRAAIALGEREDEWIVLHADGTATGPGWKHVARRVGAIPLGVGLAPPPEAPAGAWAALFPAQPDTVMR